MDNERRKQVSVTIAGVTFTLGQSEPSGHFEGDITLTGARRSGEWAEVRAVTRAGDSRAFAGKVQFIGRRGVSVVSDIDDTIEDSNVLDKRELGANTFLRDFRAAPGMAALYGRWAASGMSSSLCVGQSVSALSRSRRRSRGGTRSRKARSISGNSD